jgi:hypothetical protein
MSAPKFDRYGLHAEACECARCLLGFRPTMSNRWAARAAWERAEAKRLAEKEAAEKSAASKRPKKATVPLWERHEAERKQTEESIARMAAPVVRPATDEELAELKKEFGFKTTTRRKP